ncbi:hypothetical protein DNTS_001841 [Danionella cerebrum]|uniref:Uncharacterized protein n=1 Tax=Danionella cerebrum TaxID=2873325 RepID=A0A553RCK0_9TELE|nr:hypothetical protein DNTS_001841 [Danionella translucida]
MLDRQTRLPIFVQMCYGLNLGTSLLSSFPPLYRLHTVQPDEGDTGAEDTSQSDRTLLEDNNGDSQLLESTA